MIISRITGCSGSGVSSVISYNPEAKNYERRTKLCKAVWKQISKQGVGTKKLMASTRNTAKQRMLSSCAERTARNSDQIAAKHNASSYTQ